MKKFDTIQFTSLEKKTRHFSRFNFGKLCKQTFNISSIETIFYCSPKSNFIIEIVKVLCHFENYKIAVF